MKLFELDPNNPVDQELARTAGKATKAGSLDPNDFGGDEEFQNEPEQPMMSGMDDMNPEGEQEDEGPGVDPNKPLDTELLGRLQNHAYVTNYDHSDSKSRSNPVVISQMDPTELRQLRTRIRGIVAQNNMNDRIGMYDNPEIQAAQDMLSFVDQVLARKEAVVKNREKAAGEKPKVRQQPSPKTKPGKRFRPKKS